MTVDFFDYADFVDVISYDNLSIIIHCRRPAPAGCQLFPGLWPVFAKQVNIVGQRP